MTKYKLTENGVKDQETGAYIPNAPGNRHWREYQEWLAEGNIPDPQFSEVELIEQAKRQAIEDLNKEMLESIPTFVNVETVDGTFCMDAGKEHAWKLHEGVLFAELAGIPRLDIVDYHNKVHTEVSLESCRQIVIAQAMPYFTAWIKRAKGRQEIL